MTQSREVGLQEGWTNIAIAIGIFNGSSPNPQLFRRIRTDQPSTFSDSQAVAQAVTFEADILYKMVWGRKVPLPQDFRPTMVREAYGHPAAAVFMVQALEQGRTLRDFHQEVLISGTGVSMPGIDMLLEMLGNDIDISEFRKHFADDRTGGRLARFVGYDPKMDYIRQHYSEADHISTNVAGINALARLGANRFEQYLQAVPVKISLAPPRFDQIVDSRQKRQQNYRDAVDRYLTGNS